MSSNQITITADVAAAPDTVWTAYIDPNHITQWNFANDDWCCPKATNDLRVGGQYLARMEAKDGSFGFDFIGIYEAIDPGKSITYTLEDGRKVTTSFDPQEDATRVTTRFDAETEHPEDMQREGWQAILNNFKKHVESL